jgi:DHA1 family multidrug resistance protein-like MFS transporter
VRCILRQASEKHSTDFERLHCSPPVNIIKVISWTPTSLRPEIFKLEGEKLNDQPVEGRSWTWLLALFTFSSFIETIFFGQIGAFTPLYLPNLGVPADRVAFWTGVIAAVSGILGLPFLPFWGALADRYSRKPIIVRSFLVHLVAGVTLILAGNVYVFLVGRAITSLALGNSGLMMATLAERSPSNRQGLSFSIMNSAAPIGAFLGPLIGGPILDRWGFRTLIAVDAGLMLVVILSLVLGYRDYFKGSKERPILKMALESVHILVKQRRLQALFPALFVLFAARMLAQTYIPLVVGDLYSGQNLGTTVGFVVGAGGLAALIFSPILGAMADRYGYWRLLFISTIITIFLWPLPAFINSLLVFGIVWALINGVGTGTFAISFNVLAQSVADDVRGRVMAFSYLPVNVGLIVGPAVGSLITDYNLEAIFPAAAIFTILGVVLLAVAAKQPVGEK